MWKILCFLAALSAVAVVNAKPRAQPWSPAPRPYGRTPYGIYGGYRPYGYNRYGRTPTSYIPYRRTSSARAMVPIAITTRRTSVVMGPYGPYVNGRPVNGGYNPYRRTTRATRITSAMYARTTRRTSVVMGPYGPYVNGRPVNGGYNPYRRTTKTTRITSAMYARTTRRTSVVMGPYGPYVNGRPINGGYNPYRTSTAIGIASYSSEVISMPPISVNIWPASVIPPPPEANAGKCGGIVKVPSKGSKTITSPNYPKNYPRRADCVFTLIGPKGKDLKLQFLDMDIEKNARCFWDFIEIFEGGRNGKNLSKICSKKLRTYKVKGRRATVYFHTDGSVQKKGFKLKLTAE